MDTKEFIKLANQIRLKNKNQGYIMSHIVNGKEVIIKGFDTSLQVLCLDGVNHINTEQTEFNQHIETILN